MRLIALTALILLAAGCVSPEQVRDNVLKDLDIKYSRKFNLQSINMNHDEGNWGSANLVVFPADDESLKVHVNYDYSEMILTWEDYKGALWNREMSLYISELLGDSAADIRASITSKNSIAFDSMSLPYRIRLADVIKEIDRPRISISLKIKPDDVSRSAKRLSDAAESLLKYGFEKVSFKAELITADRLNDILKFKVTKKIHSPSISVLSKLLTSKESVSIKEAKTMYDKAVSSQKQSDINNALRIYLDIIEKYDNPYRYDPYILLESHNVIESAFAAAEILRGQGKTAESEKLYRLVVERMEFHEVKGELNDMYRTSAERLAEKAASSVLK